MQNDGWMTESWKGHIKIHPASSLVYMLKEKPTTVRLFLIYLQGAKEQDWLNIETMEKVDEGSYLPNCQ